VPRESGSLDTRRGRLTMSDPSIGSGRERGVNRRMLDREMRVNSA
jgi:hypothetical protein